MTLDIILCIVAAVLLIVGFFGTFVPVLPGAPLAWVGLITAYFSYYIEISILTLVICGIASIVVSILDNFFPIFMTKKAGGSKAATTGATIGLIIGFFIGPAGIILGPLAGAMIGELIHTQGEWGNSFKSAIGAFLGFLLGTGIKMITVLVFIWIYFRALILS